MINRYKKSDETSYALGTSLTVELFKNRPDQVKTVYIHPESIKNDVFRWLERECTSRRIPFIENDRVFRKLSEKENCYTIGVFAKYEAEIAPDKSHLVLVNPGNAGNLGTIIRSMVGFGINDLAIIAPGADVFDPKTVRASMGAVFQLCFTYYQKLEEYLATINPRPLYPFMLKGENILGDACYPEIFSLVFGNEATGLPDSYLKAGDAIRINQENTIDSLSLPIAVSIALYEFTKSRIKR